MSLRLAREQVLQKQAKEIAGRYSAPGAEALLASEIIAFVNLKVRAGRTAQSKISAVVQGPRAMPKEELVKEIEQLKVNTPIHTAECQEFNDKHYECIC